MADPSPKAALRAQRADIERRIGSLQLSLEEAKDARGDGASDDEHDPEGPTTAFEWSRIEGALADAARQLADTDRALVRLEAGRYGQCAYCGRPITAARLEAQPAAELCIDCARAASRSRKAG